jgi:hypothetical protein
MQTADLAPSFREPELAINIFTPLVVVEPVVSASIATTRLLTDVPASTLFSVLSEPHEFAQALETVNENLPVATSVLELILKLSVDVRLPPDPVLLLSHALHSPCCKFVVVELPSPVTAIEPAVDTPVIVSTLSMLAIMRGLP